MKFEKLYERIVDRLVVDGLIAEPLARPGTSPVQEWGEKLGELVDVRSALNRVYALCYDDAPDAVGVVAQVAREYGVKLDTGEARERWLCEGCTFATASPGRAEGHADATGHEVNRARQDPAAVPRTGPRYVCGGSCSFETGSSALAVDHQQTTGHDLGWTVARPAVADQQAAALEDQATALRKVLDVLPSCVETERENCEASGHRHVTADDECGRAFTPGDIRRVVEGVARDLGVTL